MDNESPEDNQQNYQNIQNSTNKKLVTSSHDPNTTNDKPKENTTSQKENAQQKTSIEHNLPQHRGIIYNSGNTSTIRTYYNTRNKTNSNNAKTK